MHLVILHYHLNRGGVTRVVQGHLEALATLPKTQLPESVNILHGGRTDGWTQSEHQELPFPVELHAVPALEYDELNSAFDELTTEQCDNTLLSTIQTILNQLGCSVDGTLLHVHNHCLGKNSSLANVIQSLAQDGWRFLLQVHDFCEELRPDSYQRMTRHYATLQEMQQTLYPIAPHVHYATLTRHDFKILDQAGVRSQNLHLLPNSVQNRRQSRDRNRSRQILQQRCNIPLDQPYVVYPVRGIRRKNLGELLLWSSMVPDAMFAVTLAPKNPAERQSYERWKVLAHELKLNVAFDVGGAGQMSLEENYAAADAMITTSIAEGFGLVFLESYMAGIPLFGRDLPSVTADFRSNGMNFPGLAAELLVPNTLFDTATLVSRYHLLNAEIHKQYGVHEPTGAEKELEDTFSGKWVDFGRLDTISQQQVLESLASDTGQVKTELKDKNPIIDELRRWLANGNIADAETNCPEMLPNRSAIESHYLGGVIGQKLRQIYQDVLVSPTDDCLSSPAIGAKVLEQFLDIDRLRPIRLERLDDRQTS